jgi:hypothetical protein
LNSSEFLKQISFIFRTFLEEEKWYKNFSKLTLEEIISFSNEEKSLWENNFINILKSIYFAEYEWIEITKEHKKELFEKVENIILNEKI